MLEREKEGVCVCVCVCVCVFVCGGGGVCIFFFGGGVRLCLSTTCFAGDKLYLLCHLDLKMNEINLSKKENTEEMRKYTVSARGWEKQVSEGVPTD